MRTSVECELGITSLAHHVDAALDSSVNVAPCHYLGSLNPEAHGQCLINKPICNNNVSYSHVTSMSPDQPVYGINANLQTRRLLISTL